MYKRNEEINKGNCILDGNRDENAKVERQRESKKNIS